MRKVTYPYIMAKVRVQARVADDDDVVDANEKGTKSTKRAPKGALDILKKTLAEAGKDLPDKVKEILLSEGGDLVR